ncbi:hypothetical protein HY604_04975 [Candidatus Peregrinibacteria bacterium]|nr:hypothetical protein [Candidatus Peregrinibacteria bacterium]
MENVETVYIEGQFLDGDILRTSVFGMDFEEGVLGIAFNLKYDNEILDFIKYEPGEFLEQGGDPFYLVSNDEDEGKIVFGETLRRDDEFPSGEGKVADFYWQIIEDGEFTFSFERGVVSTLDAVRQDLKNVDWQSIILRRDEDEELILNEQESILNTGEANSFFDLSNLFPWFAMGIFLIAIGLFISKKSFKKRTYSSVNFK